MAEEGYAAEEGEGAAEEGEAFNNHAEKMGILSSFDVLGQWEYCLCIYAIVFYTIVFDNLNHQLYCNYGSFLFLIHVDIQVIKIKQILTYWHGNAGCLSISQDVVEETACFQLVVWGFMRNRFRGPIWTQYN